MFQCSVLFGALSSAFWEKKKKQKKKKERKKEKEEPARVFFPMVDMPW
jgi:hypothetical protein